MKSISLLPSKSAAARYLIMCGVMGIEPDKSMLPKCDDTKSILDNLYQKSGIVDVGPAGTAMRFLMAYYASDIGVSDLILTGSERMLERPIQKLVDALRLMGADIERVDNGWKINGQLLHGAKIECRELESSQFISALLLIVPRISSGALVLNNTNAIPTKSYFDYTLLKLLENNYIGAYYYEPKDEYIINKTTSPYIFNELDSDWSALSFICAYMMCQPVGYTLEVTNYTKNEFTEEILKVASKFGIYSRESLHQEGILILQKDKMEYRELYQGVCCDFTNIPDEVPAFAIAAAMNNLKYRFYGCNSLKYKESDRLVAINNELKKFNIDTRIGSDGIGFEGKAEIVPTDKMIDSHKDHRIAMAFGACGISKNQIDNPDVVNKSWPGFWEMIENLYE